MKKFIKEYLRIISYTAIGLVFLISSFYLLMNYYHSEELKTRLYIPSNDPNYLSYQEKLNKISTNLTTFKSKNSTNQNLKKMYNKLLSCTVVLKGEGTLATLPVNSYFYPLDVYKLGSKFQTDVLNVCWALHLSYLTEDVVDPEFEEVSPYISNSIDMLISQTNFALEEIQNNSSYFYTTNITSATIRNYLSSDYTIIVNAYNDFADIILELSETINEKASSTGGVYSD